MHDPDVVAFDIPRPWPRRGLDRRRRYWPAIVTVWHREPGGADALTVCRSTVRDENGKFIRFTKSWKWHVHHWHIQVRPLQKLRRKLITRCSGCGGRTSKADPINIGGSWYPPMTHWWQSEADIYHQACYDERLRKAREVS